MAGPVGPRAGEAEEARGCPELELLRDLCWARVYRHSPTREAPGKGEEEWEGYTPGLRAGWWGGGATSELRVAAEPRERSLDSSAKVVGEAALASHSERVEGGEPPLDKGV